MAGCSSQQPSEAPVLNACAEPDQQASASAPLYDEQELSHFQELLLDREVLHESHTPAFQQLQPVVRTACRKSPALLTSLLRKISNAVRSTSKATTSSCLVSGAANPTQAPSSSADPHPAAGRSRASRRRGGAAVVYEHHTHIHHHHFHHVHHLPGTPGIHQVHDDTVSMDVMLPDSTRRHSDSHTPFIPADLRPARNRRFSSDAPRPAVGRPT